jgi:hypothetical protein
MVGLTGLHMRTNGIEQYPARAVVSLNGVGLGGDEQLPDTITVLRDTRVFPNGETSPDFHTFQPGAVTWDQYGRYWFKERTENGGSFRAAWDKNPTHYRIIQNEQGGNDPWAIQRMVDIDRAISWAAGADGYKCCVGNLAGGTPGDFALWQQIIAPFVIEAWETWGHVYGRHVYGQADTDAAGKDIPGTGSLVLPDGSPKPGQPARVIQELEYLKSAGYGGGGILTECGLEAGYGVVDYGRFEQQVLGWEAALRPYAESGLLIGLCWWETGGSEFNADYTAYLKQIEPKLYKGLPKWAPPEVEQPMDKHKAIVVKVAQDVTAEEWQEAAVTTYPFRHTMTASHDDMMTILAGGNEESLVKFSHPDRDDAAVDLVDAAGYGWQPLYSNGQQPEPELPYLNVEPLGQRDGRWANATLGQATGHGKTIGSWGCLLVAYTALARYWQLTTRLPDAENAHYVSQGAFSAQFIQPAALRTAYPESVVYDGFLGRESAAMRPKIREWIDNGWPVPCRVDFDPADSDFDQHWVLVIGYEGETDFYMMDPWWGDIATVNSRYAIAGSDVLEAIFYRPETAAPPPPPPPPPAQTVDMTQYYLPPNGRTYGDISIKPTNWGQGDVRQQLQLHGGYLFVTKGGEFEKRMIVDGRIYFLIDDSPGDGKYYTVNSPTGWIPAQWAVGQTFTRQETTTFYFKSNCQPTGEKSSWTNVMLFKALYPEWTSPHGIKLPNVAHLQWLVNGVVEEQYWLAAGLGYAGWSNRHGRESWIKELIPHTDQQPNKIAGSCYHEAFG